MYIYQNRVLVLQKSEHKCKKLGLPFRGSDCLEPLSFLFLVAFAIALVKVMAFVHSLTTQTSHGQSHKRLPLLPNIGGSHLESELPSWAAWASSSVKWES